MRYHEDMDDGPFPFPFLGGEYYWPLTADAGFFRAPFKRVTSKVLRSSGSDVLRRTFGSLDEALTGVAGEFSLRDDRATFFVRTRGDSWTVVLVSTFPYTGINGFMRARARLDARCDFVAYHWIPGSSKTMIDHGPVFASAGFIDVRHVRGILQRSSPFGERRIVRVSDQDDGWEFDLAGSPREYEEPEHYERRRKADRLPPELIGRYLAGVGLPVTDPNWFDDRVVVSIQPGRGLKRWDWHTITDLRAACGYPLNHVPSRLTGWERHG